MTALNKQALREKFEAWAEEAGALPWGYLKKQRNASGNYSVQIYTYMWHAWSACHESLMDELEAAEKRIAELQIARDKCFLSGLKTGWEYGIADDTEGYNREIADAQAVIDRAAGIGVKGE